MSRRDLPAYVPGRCAHCGARAYDVRDEGERWCTVTSELHRRVVAECCGECLPVVLHNLDGVRTGALR